MDTNDYGHHTSGFRKADGGPSRRFMRGLVVCAVMFVVCAVMFAVCLVWLMTHPACATPLANGICAFVAFLGVPIRLMALLAAETGID